MGRSKQKVVGAEIEAFWRYADDTAFTFKGIKTIGPSSHLRNNHTVIFKPCVCSVCLVCFYSLKCSDDNIEFLSAFLSCWV